MGALVPRFALSPSDPLARNFRPLEVVVAALSAAPIPFFAALLLTVPAGERAELAEIQHAALVPMRVTPVLDLDSPLLKLGGKRGGKKVRVKMPTAWLAPPPPRQEVEPRASAPSTKARDAASAIPTSTATAAPSSPPPEASATALPESSASLPSGDGTGGTLDPKAPGGEGSPEGVKEGTETDPLKVRAASLYYAKVSGWFRSKYHANCEGLDEAQRKTTRATASVQVADDGTVLGFSLARSGHDAVDSAAEGAMGIAAGQQIPPPPENYPELRRNSFSVTFVCSK